MNVQARWTIEQLVRKVERALEADSLRQWSGRVSEVPGLRTIRYYTTIGLLDRPAEIRGRTAYYSSRHLMQLMAIKRLQAEGLSLAEIQNRLLGLSDSELAQIARLPDVALKSESGPASFPLASRRLRFWASAPSTSHEPREAGSELETWQSVRLGKGMRLLLETDALLDADAVREIQSAARPMLRILQSRSREFLKESEDEPHGPSTS